MSGFKKAISAILLLTLLMGVMASCADNTEIDDSGEPESGSDIGTEYLDIVKDGVAANIVYAANASSHEIRLAELLENSIETLCQVDVKTYAEGTVKNSESVEFLIGNTKYEESQATYSKITYSKSKIEVNGNKIVVAGYDEKSYRSALGTLIMRLEQDKDESGNIRLAKDFSAESGSNDILDALPVLSGLSPTITDSGEGSYILTFEGAKGTDLNTYVNALIKEGFTEYANKAIEGNRYYTFVKDKYIVNVMHAGRLRIIAESTDTTALPTKAEQNVYTPVEGLATTLTQIGIADGDPATSVDYYNGMSYVMRLCDGSFIVIDGGHATEECAARLYNTMKKQSPTDDITIAAWIFTHAHYDHVGTFQTFTSVYGDKVNIEAIIMNIPGEEQRNGIADERSGVKKSISQYCGESTVIKAHPGQVFNIKNAVVTMLYTFDINDTDLTDYNNVSLVFTVEAEGVKALFLGDYSEQGVTLLNRYGQATLECDIVQVSHHGFGGMNNNLYVTAKPKYAFIPNGAYHVAYTDSGKTVDEDIREKPNQAYIFKNLTEDKIFLAADDVTVLTLSEGNITASVYDSNAEYVAS